MEAYDILLLGLAFLLIEAIIPGFGIFGFIGLWALLWSLFFLLGADLLAGLVCLLVAICVIGGFLYVVSHFHKGWIGKYLTLHWQSTSDKGYISAPLPKDLVGKTGVARSILRPAGIVDIDGQPVNVVTEGDFYEAGTKVIVIRVDGTGIVVRRYDTDRGIK